VPKTCIDTLNEALSGFTPEERRTIADTLATQIRAASFPPIQRADLTLSEQCNCCCTYCFEGKKSPIVMSPNTLQRAMDFVFRESRSFRQVSFVLFGGEPLMQFELVRQAIQYGNQKALELDKQVHFEMTTNGTLLNKEIIDFGAAHSLSYLISLDGDRETHDRHRRLLNGEGTYDTIVRWIPYLKMRQAWLGSRVTPAPDTVHKLASNIRHLRSLGINQFIIGMSSGSGWTPEKMEIYRQQWEDMADYYIMERKQKAPIRIYQFEDSWEDKIEKNRYIWGCSGGRNQIAISATGEIYPCSRFSTLMDPCTHRRGAYRLGSLEEGMSDLRFRDELHIDFGSCRINCLGCEFAEACIGTCLAVNYEANNSVFDCRGYFCEENKILLDLVRRRPELKSASTGEYLEQGIINNSHIKPI